MKSSAKPSPEGAGHAATGRAPGAETLSEGERRQRALLELSYDWYWVQDEHYRFTVREGVVLERNAFPPADDLGKTLWDVGYLNMDEAAWAAHRDLLARREEFRNLLLKRRNRDGESRWARLSGRPLYDADGTFIGYHGIGHGVTAEVEAEIALRDSEAQLRLLTDSVPVAISYVDRDWVLRFVNRGFLDMFGHHAGARVGIRLQDSMGEAIFREVEPHFRRVFDGESVSYRRSDAGLDGRFRTINVNLVPRRGDDGGVIGCYTVSMDVSSIEQAEAKIRVLERSFTSALEATTDMMAMYRREGGELIIEQFNAALRRFYEERFPGIRIADWIGRSIEAFLRTAIGLAPEALDQRMVPFRRAAATGQVVRYRSSIESPSGLQQRDALLVPITDGEGRVTHLFYRGADITELAQKEQELVRLNAELERKVTARTAELSTANRELEAFAYSVSHDLRAPLRGIDGFSNLLLENSGDRLGADGMANVQRIRKGILRMGALIDDLLQLSRVTRGKFTRERVDLSALAREVAADLQRQAIARRVDWRLAGDVTAVADPGLMRVVLENLLGNAWKYTRDSAAPVIEFAAERKADGVEFCVRDNGAGFDMAYAGKLFKAFQRLHGQKEFEGTGIGLATVGRIAERHGGRVRAYGEPGKGAVIHVFLPDEGATR
jgi:PAS domain S-box-containing protein